MIAVIFEVWPNRREDRIFLTRVDR